MTMKQLFPIRAADPRRLARGASWSLALITLGACASRGTEPLHAGEATPERASLAQRCKPLPEVPSPTPISSAPVAPLKGQVWLTARLPRKRLIAEVEARLGETLASDRGQPIGAPGRVTYAVRRGRVSLDAGEHGFSLRVPVDIDLSVCKPLGSLCITYGRCAPSYDITATVPAGLRSNGELPEVHLARTLRRGCTIGIDVTPHVTRVVDEQLARVQGQIRRDAPRLAPELDALLEELRTPIPVSSEACIGFLPTRLLADEPRLDGDDLVWSVGLSAETFPTSCQQRLAAPKHPGFRRKERPKTPHLDVPELLATDDVLAALRTHLARAQDHGTGAILSVEVLSLTPSGESLLAEMHIAGANCGRVFVELRPQVRQDRLALALASVVGPELPKATLAALKEQLAGPLPLPIATAGWMTSGEPELLLAAANAIIADEADLQLSLRGPKRAAIRARVASQGVLLTTRLRTDLELQAHPRK